jgi:hypothetical protein
MFAIYYDEIKELSSTKAFDVFCYLVSYICLTVKSDLLFTVPSRLDTTYLLFYVPLKNISLIWRRHHYWRGLQNSGLCSAPRAEGSLSCHTCFNTAGTTVFPVLSEGPPYLVASYDKQGYSKSYPIAWVSNFILPRRLKKKISKLPTLFDLHYCL